jgi:hypothetical protein
MKQATAKRKTHLARVHLVSLPLNFRLALDPYSGRRTIWDRSLDSERPFRVRRGLGTASVASSTPAVPAHDLVVRKRACGAGADVVVMRKNF